MKLRDYQLEAIESVRTAYLNGVRKQLICLPTGTGKTVIMAFIAKTSKRPILILVHTEELVRQTVAKLQDICQGKTIGVVKAAENDYEADIVVASVQSAHRKQRLSLLCSRDFGIVIIDEAHHAIAKSYRKIIDALTPLPGTNSLLIGVTATPIRGDKSPLNKVFDKIVFDRSMALMIRAGYLAPLVSKSISTEVDLTQVSIRLGDFNVSQLEKCVDTPIRNTLVVNAWKEHASNRTKTLCFCVSVDHAKHLNEAFLDADISSSCIYGDMPLSERRSTIDLFTTGKLSVLINCMILTEGFDCPGIDCILLCRPTKSSALFIQTIGRGTRQCVGKTDSLILDFQDNLSSHTDACSVKSTLEGSISYTDEQRYEPAESIGNTYDHIPVLMGQDKPLSYKDKDIHLLGKTAFKWASTGNGYILALSTTCYVEIETHNQTACYVVAYNGTSSIDLSNIRIPVTLSYAQAIGESWALDADKKMKASIASNLITPKQRWYLMSRNYSKKDCDLLTKKKALRIIGTLKAKERTTSNP